MKWMLLIEKPFFFFPSIIDELYPCLYRGPSLNMLRDHIFIVVVKGYCLRHNCLFSLKENIFISNNNSVSNLVVKRTNLFKKREIKNIRFS